MQHVQYVVHLAEYPLNPIYHFKTVFFHHLTDFDPITWWPKQCLKHNTYECASEALHVFPMPGSQVASSLHGRTLRLCSGAVTRHAQIGLVTWESRPQVVDAADPMKLDIAGLSPRKVLALQGWRCDTSKTLCFATMQPVSLSGTHATYKGANGCNKRCYGSLLK